MPSPRRRAHSAAYPLLPLLLLHLLLIRESISLEMSGACPPAKRGRPPHPCRRIITPHRQNALTGTCAYCGIVVPFDVDSSTSHIVFLCPSISDSARTQFTEELTSGKFIDPIAPWALPAAKRRKLLGEAHRACALSHAQPTRCAAGTARLVGHCTFSETHQHRWPPIYTALRPYKGLPPMWKRIFRVLRHLYVHFCPARFFPS